MLMMNTVDARSSWRCALCQGEMSHATLDVTGANNVTVVFNNEKSFPMYLRIPQRAVR